MSSTSQPIINYPKLGLVIVVILSDILEPTPSVNLFCNG